MLRREDGRRSEFHTLSFFNVFRLSVHYGRGNRGVLKIFQSICSSLAVPLINPSVISQILKSSLKYVHNFLFIDHIDQLECSRIRYSILIGQLTGSCESEELRN